MGNQERVTEADLDASFVDGEGAALRAEARDRYGDEVVRESERRLRNLTKEEFTRLKDEGDDITRHVADLIGRDAASPEVQEQMERFYRYMNRYFDCSPAAFRGLGELYVADQRFAANYRKYHEDLPEFMRDAMARYSELKAG